VYIHKQEENLEEKETKMNYNNYSDEALENYIVNTRKNAAQFDREGSYKTATIHYNEALRAQSELISRNSK
jgi:hypothetical protein